MDSRVEQHIPIVMLEKMGNINIDIINYFPIYGSDYTFYYFGTYSFKYQSQWSGLKEEYKAHKLDIKIDNILK